MLAGISITAGTLTPQTLELLRRLEAKLVEFTMETVAPRTYKDRLDDLRKHIVAVNQVESEPHPSTQVSQILFAQRPIFLWFGDADTILMK